MKFIKMQGAGNDYVYLDCVHHKPPRNPAELSRLVSDRRFGIGSDGLIMVCPSERADAKMRMFNADGSEAEMCGNGIRCVAKLVYDYDIGRKSPMTIETGNGVLTLEVEVSGGKVERVRVDMGEPILESAKIPTILPGDPPVNAELKVEDRTFLVTCVSMGNPHCVTYVDELTDPLVSGYGPRIETHPAFPNKVNAEFVVVNNEHDITMRVRERGSGETWACGTGACAVAVAGVLTGRTARRITAHLRGGDLELEWSESDNHVYMTGPAVEVFTGEWPDEE